MKTITYKNYTITQEINQGTVKVSINGDKAPITKRILRKLAQAFGVGLFHKTGTEKNTRHLGAHIIKAIENLT